MLKNKKAQSTLEYVILIAAVIAVMLLFLGTPGSPFRSALDNVLNETSQGMEDMSGRLADSRGDQP